jgi:hypothetical protein
VGRHLHTLHRAALTSQKLAKSNVQTSLCDRREPANASSLYLARSPDTPQKTGECAAYWFGIEVIICEFRRLQFCIRHASDRCRYSSSGCSEAGSDLLSQGGANHIERVLHATTDAARFRQRSSGRGVSAVRLLNRKLVAEPRGLPLHSTLQCGLLASRLTLWWTKFNAENGAPAM